MRSFISPAALLVKVTGEDPTRIDAVVIDEARDARGEHARLAGAGAGEHEQRAVDVQHRLALRGIQPVEQRIVSRNVHHGKIISNVAPRSDGGELQRAAVILLDDAAREREADAPPARLRREAGLEDAARASRAECRGRRPRREDAPPSGRALGGDRDAAAAAGERVDRVLDEHLERPLEQHRVARAS